MTKPEAHWPRLPSATTGERMVAIADDWNVWAFSDPHGVTSGFSAALLEAGLVDAELRWSAPPGTALVGCGDYLDRGRDSRGTLALLRRLQPEAEAAGGRVVLLRGNHEEMLVHLWAGRHQWLPVWLAYGGHATLESFGCAPEDPMQDEPALREVEAAAPGTFAWLESLAQAARWRDVIFVHGGLPPDHAPDDLGTITDAHLWIRSEFFDTPWESGAFDGYRRAGVERVVFGHSPGADGARIMQGGRLLNLDSNACGNPRMPPDARKMITLAELGDGSFDRARRVVIPTDNAPDGALTGDRATPMLDYR
ncbi:MAG TPA: metallophosphoesterase [Candidatus Limnocylindria bacterium]